jgi:hypothetical protein
LIALPINDSFFEKEKALFYISTIKIIRCLREDISNSKKPMRKKSSITDKYYSSIKKDQKILSRYKINVKTSKIPEDQLGYSF